jgi:aryl-alcohol dehydrogenase-like predicted oxidoreductase
VPDTINQLGFGGAALSSMRSYGAVQRLLDKAYDNGITHFDTAPLYGRGYSEILIGAFIKKKRDKVTVATKFGLGGNTHTKLPVRLALPLNYYQKKLRGIKPPAPGEANATPLPQRLITASEIKEYLKGSLERLKTDYIDYYLLHEGLPWFLDEKAKGFLQEQKAKGVIRKIGVATDGYNIERLNETELEGWDVLQYEADYNKGESVLTTRYHNKEHIQHSCLKFLGRLDVHVPQHQKAGYVLANCAQKNMNGKMLFSTRQPKKLTENVAAFKLYYN